MYTSKLKPDLLNPDWEPSDEELETLVHSLIEDVKARATSVRQSLDATVAMETENAFQTNL
jgi:hypothetical protein